MNGSDLFWEALFCFGSGCLQSKSMTWTMESSEGYPGLRILQIWLRRMQRNISTVKKDEGNG